jgi:iron complex outermembrane receptor protein/vitamin B12 transporter
MRRSFPLAVLAIVTVPAHAVIVRGVVTSPAGVPLAGARVQLILGPRSVADTISGVDGSYEIRTALAGRFVLLTSASITAKQPAVQISPAFYGGRTDDLQIDIALDPSALTPQTSTLANRHETTLLEGASAVSQIAADQLLTREEIPGLIPETVASAFVVTNGQTGAPAELYLRGASPASTKVLVDGVSAERLGGGFALNETGTVGLAAVATAPAFEVVSGANPLYPTGAASGVLAFHSAGSPLTDGFSLRYAGDAGVLDTLRNSVEVDYTKLRFDGRAAISRFDTANAAPAIKFHRASGDANLGYRISGNTGLRFTLRDDVAAGGLPSPFAFYGVQPQGRLASQNLDSGLSFTTRTGERWNHLLRFGIARNRTQTQDFATPDTGLPVTITGANGTSATGTATFLPLPLREDRVSNRDESTYQTSYDYRPWLHALMVAQYQDERAADLLPAGLATHPSLRMERTHLSLAGGLKGDIRHRVFYEAYGVVDDGTTKAGAPNPQYSPGVHGSPRLGLTWAAVRPGKQKVRGTTLHASLATGFRESSIEEQAAFSSNHLVPRSRTFDAGVEQNLLRQKMSVRATYFHNQFAHETEVLAPETTAQAETLSNALAFRTQGLELTARYTPTPRVFLTGGYTYLASLVEQTAATGVLNPGFAGVPIGATTALLGARPFHRPPHSGFVSAQYSGRSLNAAIHVSFAGRSDDTTGLVLNPGLLLPNRNLSPGFAGIDASVLYNATHRLAVYTQLDNLADSRHLAPIGYISTPFVVRAGVRVRLGRE